MSKYKFSSIKVFQSTKFAKTVQFNFQSLQETTPIRHPEICQRGYYSDIVNFGASSKLEVSC